MNLDLGYKEPVKSRLKLLEEKYNQLIGCNGISAMQNSDSYSITIFDVEIRPDGGITKTYSGETTFTGNNSESRAIDYLELLIAQKGG